MVRGCGSKLGGGSWSCNLGFCFAPPSVRIQEGKDAHELFCTNFLNNLRGPGHPGKIFGTSQIPLFETQGRQAFEGGHELFGHHPFVWKTPPPGGLRTQKVNLCALFSCLKIFRAIFSHMFSNFYGLTPEYC